MDILRVTVASEVGRAAHLFDRAPIPAATDRFLAELLKLSLRDRMTFLDDQLTPDIIA